MTSQPAGFHPGVLCDKTLAPIVGFRYTDGKGYDLCQAEFDKLSTEEQRRFQRLAPPITPRRVLLAGALAFGGVRLSSLFHPPPSSVVQDGCSGARQASTPSDVSADCYAAFDTPYGTLADDFLMPPPPSAAERLVDFFFKPQVPAGRREADPTARRRVGGRATEDLIGPEPREPVARRSAPAAEPDRI